MESNEKYFSMPKKKILEYVSTSRKELIFCRELLRKYLKPRGENRWLVSTLCDLYSANYKMLSELSMMLEYGTDEESDTVLLTREDVTIVETIIIAKHYCTRELNMRGNLSVSVH
tara:strand:- start:6306 stop:6650 length:345 start_codon:yes stop_codon:yes gene_type:complete